MSAWRWASAAACSGPELLSAATQSLGGSSRGDPVALAESGAGSGDGPARADEGRWRTSGAALSRQIPFMSAVASRDGHFGRAGRPRGHRRTHPRAELGERRTLDRGEDPHRQMRRAAGIEQREELMEVDPRGSDLGGKGLIETRGDEAPTPPLQDGRRHRCLRGGPHGRARCGFHTELAVGSVAGPTRCPSGLPTEQLPSRQTGVIGSPGDCHDPGHRTRASH